MPQKKTPASVDRRGEVQKTRHTRAQPARIYVDQAPVGAGDQLQFRPLFPIREFSVESILNNSDIVTELENTAVSLTPVPDNGEARGSWAPVRPFLLDYVSRQADILTRPGLVAIKGFFDHAPISRLTDWSLLSAKMARFCSLPHAREMDFNSEFVTNAECCLQRYFLESYDIALKNVLKAEYLVSSQSLCDYFSEVVRPVLDRVNIEDRFQQIYLCASLDLIDSVEGVDVAVQREAYEAVSAVIQRDVLSCIMSPALNASLSPKARDEWMSSLVQAEYRDALLAAVYVSVNGDADQDISPRTPYLTGYCCNFLEHVFRFPKNSLNPFPDF